MGEKTKKKGGGGNVPRGATPVPIAEEVEIERLSGRETSNAATDGATEKGKAKRMENTGESSIVKLTKGILARGIAMGASDIFFCRDKDGLWVDYGIYGQRVREMDLPIQISKDILFRVLAMAGFSTKDLKKWKRGRFGFLLEEKDEYFIRTDLMPLHNNIQLRLHILDGEIPPPEQLGFTGEQLKQATSLFDRPMGLILIVSGPDSGRSTTIRSFALNASSSKWPSIQIDAPIEVPLGSVCQVSADESGGLNYDACLEAFSHQNCPSLTLGTGWENRPERIHSVFDIALSGTLVAAELKAPDAASGIRRLVALGADPDILAEVLIGVCAQTLASRPCPECFVQGDPTPSSANELGITLEELLAAAPPRLNTGCKRCKSLGATGRFGLFEVFPATPQLLDQILNRATASKIRATLSERATTMPDRIRELLLGKKITVAEACRLIRSIPR